MQATLYAIRKTHAQLQFSQAGAIGAKMGSNGDVSGIFIGFMVPSLHGQQFTHLCSRNYTYVHHKSDGLVRWQCSILPSSTKQTVPTRLQMH